MKKLVFLFILGSWHVTIMAQIPIPIILPSFLNPNYYNINELPKSNELISFSSTKPYVINKDSIISRQTTYHFLISLSSVKDSLLSECIKFAMLSFNYEQAYRDLNKGAEIWYGVSKGDIETYAGIYYKNFTDSTRLYVLTTFSWEKKSKMNISKLICERIKTIVGKQQGMKTH